MNVKNLGQVFTPKYIVDFILDEVGYKNKDLINKTILEPSAGNGAFVLRIIDRIFKICKKENIDSIKILEIIKKNVFAIELDKNKYDELIFNSVNHINSKINNKIDKNFFINNFINDDALFIKDNRTYDFIVGNPPYVRLHNLNKDYIKELRKNYHTMKNGNVDLYYAFYESSLKKIKPEGKLAFISPNNFLINNSGRVLREILENKISNIFDFQSQKIFINAMTYNAILIIKNNSTKIMANLPIINNEIIKKSKNIQTKIFNGKIIIPKSNNDIFKIFNENKPNLNFKNGLATLADSIFITRNFEIVDDFFYMFNNHLIESDLLIDVVKISNNNANRKAIFPYKIENDKIIPMKLEEIKKYKNGYDYLLKHKELLEKRSLEKNCEWFLYGRSQALNSVLQDKVVLKTLVKDSIEFYFIKKSTLVYSGLFSEVDYNKNKKKEIEDFLNNEALFDYIKSFGSDRRGNYKQMNSSIMSYIWRK